MHVKTTNSACLQDYFINTTSWQDSKSSSQRKLQQNRFLPSWDSCNLAVLSFISALLKSRKTTLKDEKRLCKNGMTEHWIQTV